MTPSPNVEALARLVNEYFGTSHTMKPQPTIAEWLASRGVLATEALTDTEAFGLVGGDGGLPSR